MTAWSTILRGAPELDGTPAPGPLHRGPGLARRVATILHFAGTSLSDAFGAVLVVRGRRVLHALLVVPDDTDPGTLSRLRRWGARHPVDTVAGPAPWRVLTLPAYFDGRATRMRQPWAFLPCAYSGMGPVIGADLGRTFGLVAEYVVIRQGASSGSWEVWPPGWGTRGPKGNVRKRSANRPPLRVRSRRIGWSVEFGPVERGHGKWTSKGPWRGEFVDLESLAYTFDADRGAGFVEHARNFGIAADELPVTASLDADGAGRLAAAVTSLHALAVRLDTEVGRWFTSSYDQASDVLHRLPAARLQSPAAIADHLLRRFGVGSPLARFDLTAAELAAWWEAFHGGRCDDVPGLRGRPFDGAVLDVTSAYSLVAHLIGWWNLLTAGRLVRRDVTAEMAALCERAATDPSVVCDPATWATFGCTLVELAPDGDVLPVALDDPTRPDGRTEVVPVTAHGRTLSYGWPDVVSSAVTTGQVPRIVRAVRLVPTGRQDGLRQRVPFLPGTTLALDADPALALVERRRSAKAEGDTTTAAMLHAAVNALVSGQPSRLDDTYRKVGNRWQRVERNGPWTLPPLAVTVTAGARLLLAVLDRLVRDRGGIVAYRDTDSSIIPASADGGTLTLADGSVVRVLTYLEVDELRNVFDPLSPDPATWPVWKMAPGPVDPPLRCVVFGLKHHVEWTGPDDAPVLVDWTESGLGGTWSDPPSLSGRCAEGGQAWSRAAVIHQARYAAAKQAATPRHPAIPGPVAWDTPGTPMAPTLRRLAVTSPMLLATLPASLGARPGTRYVEAVSLPGHPHVVALDPGGPLTDWCSLGWVDRRTGEHRQVSTDPMDLDAVQVEPLWDRAMAYGAAPRGESVEAVTVTPLSVLYRGRVSPVIDAEEDGVPGALAAERVRYENVHGLGPGQFRALVELAGSTPRRFATLTGVSVKVARNIAHGRLSWPATTRAVVATLRRAGGVLPPDDLPECALDGCSHPVAGVSTCSVLHLRLPCTSPMGGPKTELEEEDHMSLATSDSADDETAGMSATCLVCSYADQYGCWPPDHQGTHCRRCHRSWTSKREAHCAVCCAHFSSDTTAEFHWHRTRHWDPEDVPGLHLGTDGIWSTDPDRDPAALHRRMTNARRAREAVR